MEFKKIHKQLHRKLLENDSAGDLLRILHKDLNKQLVLQYNDEYRLFPSPSNKQQKHIIEAIETNKKRTFLKEPIELFYKTIAHLILFKRKENITQYEYLALTRNREMLTQYFWKHHLERETTLLKKNEWILEAISGVLFHDDIVNDYEKNMLMFQ